MSETSRVKSSLGGKATGLSGKASAINFMLAGANGHRRGLSQDRGNTYCMSTVSEKFFFKKKKIGGIHKPLKKQVL